MKAGAAASWGQYSCPVGERNSYYCSAEFVSFTAYGAVQPRNVRNATQWEQRRYRVGRRWSLRIFASSGVGIELNTGVVPLFIPEVRLPFIDLPGLRQKKVWNGARKQRRKPIQSAWSEDDFRERERLIVERICLDTEQSLGLVADVVADVLGAWVGKITRVELSKVIRELGLLKKTAIALEVFYWAQKQQGRLKPNPHVYSSILGVLGRAGMSSKAREIFDSLDSKNLESVHLNNAMMAAYVKAGKFRRAWKLYEHMSDNGVAPDEVTFNTLLNGIAQATSPVEMGEKLFERMKHFGVAPGPFTFNTLITVFSKAGHLNRAEGVLAEMRTAGESPDLCTFNTFLSMYAKAGKYELALKTYEDLKSAGLKPNVITYTNMIQMFSHGLKHEEALGIYFEMEKAECKPDLMTFSLLVNVYGKAGMVAEAGKMFEQLQTAGFQPNVVTWSSLIQAYGRQGMVEEAASYFIAMKNSGCRPDATIYNIMMNAYLQETRSFQATCLFRQMQAQGIVPNAASFNTMIRAYSEGGQLEDAKAMHEQMTRAGFHPDKLTKKLLTSVYSGGARRPRRLV